jgi:hypothetical protein
MYNTKISTSIPHNSIVFINNSVTTWLCDESVSSLTSLEEKETNTNATGGIQTHDLSARDFHTLFKEGTHTTKMCKIFSTPQNMRTQTIRIPKSDCNKKRYLTFC